MFSYFVNKIAYRIRSRERKYVSVEKIKFEVPVCLYFLRKIEKKYIVKMLFFLQDGMAQQFYFLQTFHKISQLKISN